MTNKPIIETMINTAALALTAWGVTQITSSHDGWECLIKGVIIIFFGAGLEWFKYFGRHKEWW